MSFLFFQDTATTAIYTLSLHDALPISCRCCCPAPRSSSLALACASPRARWRAPSHQRRDRKSTRLNSSSRRDLVCRLLLEKKKIVPLGTHTSLNHNVAEGIGTRHCECP